MLPRCNVLIGRAGTGKSRLMRILVAPCPRLIIVDTMMEHGGVARDVDIEELYRVTSSPGNFQVAHYPQDREDFDWICQLAASKPNTSLAIDEYSMWYPAAQMAPNPGVLAIVRCGRKLRQNLFVITQSPGAITKQITGQSAVWVFHMDEGNDCKYILNRTSGTIDPSELGPIEEHGEFTVRTHIARYFQGRREDFELNLATLQIRPFSSE